MDKKSEYLKLFDKIFDTNTIKMINEINMPMLHTFFENIQGYLNTTNQDLKESLKKSANMYNELNSTLNEKQQEMFKNYAEFKNKLASIVDEQLFMFGYLTAIQLREETIEQFKSNCKNEKIKKSIEYFRGKTLEEGDNLTMTVDFLENLEVLLDYIKII